MPSPCEAGEEQIGPSPELIASPPPIRGTIVRYWQSDPDRFEAPRRVESQDARNPPATGRESPWVYPSGSTERTQRLHHRSTLLEFRDRLGVDEQHGRWVDDPGALRTILETRAADVDQWWVKSGFTTSGRHRVVVAAGADPGAALSLLARSPELVRRGVLVEPGRARVADYGAVGWVGDDGGACRTVGPRVHRMAVTPGGQFGGLTSRVEDEARARVTNTWNAVARVLHAEGHRGPFGIDAFEYRTKDDSPGWVDLCEVNVRLTFGHVAHAWARLLGAAEDWLFHVGRETPPRGATVLLPAAEADPTAAWLASLIR